ncbi:MAG: hypothetical protein B9S32_00730 [Verrucomicrobia bacterium Tous-C9LFEB]|nr:MAG: hypothetical protein B9S32_00730 [Verrucomicrobia bacterium Tous-C9LFEB]
MKSSLLSVGLLGFALLGSVTGLRAQTIDLLHDASSPVLTAGSYTYYARGAWSGTANVDATPFTTVFWPGYSATAAYNHSGTSTGLTSNEGYATTIQDNGSATAIPITGNIAGYSASRGKLTDGSASTYVSGWQGVLSSSGTFDILIDLGSICDISTVRISYTDSSGRRWNSTVGAQSVYYATTLSATPADSDFTLLATGTTTNGASAATLDFTGASTVSARYIDLRLSTGSLAYGGTSYGGILNEVYVLGAVPEPTTMAFLAGGAGILVLGLRRRRFQG